MKCSAGVAVWAAVVLLGSALTLASAAGTAYVFLGPISGQLFDPATLPPGADVQTMRAFGIVGATIFALFGGLGAATGVGLIRLWRWARYSMIAFGGCAAVLSVFSAVLFLFLPAPPNAAQTPQAFAAVRIAVIVFYIICALVGAAAAWYFARASTAAQFNGGGADVTPPSRPISITIIAWLMIVSGVLMMPSVLLMRLPALLMGLILTGMAAKTFYALYTVAYLVIGIGLLRKTADALIPAIVLQTMALLNGLAMLLPSVWARYQAAVATASPLMANAARQPTTPAMQFVSVGFGILFAGAILFFLNAARRTIAR